ncbi:MAG: sugar ABC transporter permease [Clostridia bacterium]|nr:sugar ABC transporter permease [Clostridia bacterium]
MSQTPVQNKPKKKNMAGGFGRQAAYLTMVLPGTLFLLAFAYLPMPGIVLAFKFYKMQVPQAGDFFQNVFLNSLVKSEWNGLNNFTYLLNDAWMLIRNTVGYNLLFMIVGVVLQVGLAVLINELRNRKTAKVYHTIMFMPYFVSWIVVMYALYAMIAFNGFFNQVAVSLGGTAVKYYSEKQYWPWIFLIANIWKYTGQGSIIYLATLTGFDEQLYEAGAIDGASKWQQFRFITLPQLMPTIVMLQILAIGRIFNGDFDMFYSLPNGSGTLRQVTTTIDVYVYDMLKKGNLRNSFGYASAGAFFQSVVGFVLILVTNRIVKKHQPDMALF